MPLRRQAGSFAMNVGVGNQVIVGLGFTPKIVLFYPSMQTANGIGEDSHASFGAAISSGSQFAMTGNSQNGVNPSGTSMESRTDKCIMVNIAGAAAPIYEATFVSQDADGFTINVTFAPGSAYMVGYLALGGSNLSDVYIGNDTMKVGAIGAKATVGVGFQPDAILIAHVSLLGTDTSGPNAIFGLGAATDPTERGALVISSRDAIAGTNVSRWQETDAVLLNLTVLGLEDAEADLDSFDADGFTLDYSNTSAAAVVFFFIAFKGDLDMFVGSFNTRMGGGHFNEAGVGFSPDAGLFWSILNVTTAGRDATDNKLSMGAATETTERVVVGALDEQTPPSSDADNFFSDTLLYQNYDHAQVQLGAIDFIGWDADGFTINQTDPDPALNEVIYFVFGGGEFLIDVTPLAVTMRLDAERPSVGTRPIVLLDQPTCDIDTPGLAEYKVRLKNQSGAYVAEFDNWISLVLTHKVNNRGTVRFEINGEDERTDLFVLDGQIEVWRRNSVVDLDWYPEWKGFFRTSNDLYEQNDNNKYVAFGFSYLDLARRAEIKYDAGTAEADKSGVGETVIKEYVPENIGISALIANGRAADNVMPGLSIEADLGNGLQWDGARADKNLLQTIQEIGIATGIDFDIIGAGTALFQFVTYDGQKTDRTKGNTDGNAPVIFSLGFGNMVIPVLSKNRSTELTAVYALGKGVDDARQSALEESANAINSPWNRIEKTVSASNTFGDDLISAAQETLEKNKFDPKFNFSVLQQVNAYYGKHFTWGDRVTAEYKGEEFDKKIIEVQVNVSAQAAGESISIKFADN